MNCLHRALRFLLPIPILLVAALTAPAQTPAATPATITLKPAATPGTIYTYAVTVHSQITRSGGGGALPELATLDNAAQVEMKILPPTGEPGSMDVQLRFVNDKTTVQAAPDLLATLQQQVQATDRAALTMDAVHFRIGPGDKFETVSRSGGDDYDQPVLVLDQIARTDSLPLGEARVGDHWTRPRTQIIPTMHFSVPLTMDCSLTAIGGDAAHPVASVSVHSHGATDLPADSIPDLAQLANAGVVPTASLEFTSDATSQYSVPNAVLESTSSKSHNVLHLSLTGMPQETQTSDTTIDSTGSVKLIATKPTSGG